MKTGTSDGPSSGKPPDVDEVGSPLSEELIALLTRASERVFPTDPELVFRFDVQDEKAEDLVPDDFLEKLSVPIDPPDDDFADHFTLVGDVASVSQSVGVDSLPPADTQDPRAISPSVEQEGDFSEVHTWPSHEAIPQLSQPAVATARHSAQPVVDPDLGEPTANGRNRAGTLSWGGLSAVLWRLIERRADAVLSLSLPTDLHLRLTFVHGELNQFEGPVARRVAERTKPMDESQVRPRNEDEAVALLEHDVRVGERSRYALEKALRREREQLLGDALVAESGSFILEPLEGSASGLDERRVFHAPLPVVIVETSRARVSGALLRSRLSASTRGSLKETANFAFRVTPDAALRFKLIQLEPELLSVFEDSKQFCLSDITQLVPEEAGLFGLLFELFVSGALELVVDVAASGETAVLDTLKEWTEVVDAGDYFALLKVERQAKAVAIQEAYAQRLRELQHMRKSVRTIETERLWANACKALQEAYELLRDDRLRESYVEALESGSLLLFRKR